MGDGRSFARGGGSDVDRLADELAAFPPGTKNMDYLISCLIEASQLDSLLGNEGDEDNFFRYVEDATQTQLEIVHEEVEPGKKKISVTGNLPNVYVAQTLLIGRTK